MTSTTTSIATNIAAITTTIRRLERRYGRPPGSVKLLAVSKQHAAAQLKAAYNAGLRDFGESYLQEASNKIAVLEGWAGSYSCKLQEASNKIAAPEGLVPPPPDQQAADHNIAQLERSDPGPEPNKPARTDESGQQHGPGGPHGSDGPHGSGGPHESDLCWHFIGPLQANKTRGVAQQFSWVHSVDRPRLAHRLSAQRPARLPPLNVCVQVRLSAEPGKAGAEPATVAALCALITTLPGLRLRGLMAIPAPTRQLSEQRHNFRVLAARFKQLRQLYPELDTLSMGMSGDYEAAIAEGATLVRIGTGIFGPRGTGAC